VAGVIARLRERIRRRLAATIAGRAGLRFQRLRLREGAATITYYAMLSLFPALLFGVSVAGIVGGRGLVEDAQQAALDAGLGPEAQQVVGEAVDNALGSASGALGIASAISLGLALYGASGVLDAAGRQVEAVFGIAEGEREGLLRRRAELLVLAAGIIALVMVVIAATFAGGDVAADLFGDAAGTVWSIVRWPLALGGAALAVSAVFRWAPASHDARRSAVLAPGALLVVALWVLLSAGFALYLRNFGNYGAIYGTFASAVVLLLWLNLCATALLFGAAVEAEREHGLADTGQRVN
jgi:membrane protein